MALEDERTCVDDAEIDELEENEFVVLEMAPEETFSFEDDCAPEDSPIGAMVELPQEIKNIKTRRRRKGLRIREMYVKWREGFGFFN